MVVVAAGLLVLSLILPAGAAPREEAKRKFKAGMQLIAEGQLDEGIDQLEVAYDILPHPNVLFNMGLAFMDVNRGEEAIPYWAHPPRGGISDLPSCC